MPTKFLLALCLQFIFSSILIAGDHLLTNSPLNLTDQQTYPTAWQGAKSGCSVMALQETLPDGVDAGVRIKPDTEQKYLGFMLQAITLDPTKATNMILTGYARAQSPAKVLLEVKLFAQGKEIKRIDSKRTNGEWEKLRIAFHTGKADKMQVLCRWTADEKSLGKACDFAALSLLAKDKCLAIVGDSTVEDYLSGDSKRGWGQMLEASFNQAIAVNNHAAGGRSTKTFLSEKRWDAVLATKPNFVLIQFGHNDSHALDRPESTDANGTYRDNLIRYIKEARVANCEPVLVTPPHRRIFRNGKLTQGLTPYAKQMRLVASELQVGLIDLYEMTGKHFENLGEEAAIPLFCNEKDRSHFSELGASTLAKMITESLPQTCPGLAKYLQDQTH